MHLRVEGDPRSHPVWRDATAALMCTQRLVRLARETGKRVHVLHVTTREEIAFLAGHKDVASCEATPAHLTLAAPDCYERLGTLAQLNPPVRDAGASRRHLARAGAGRHRHPRLRPLAAHPRGKGASLSEDPFRHDRRADAGADHARSRQCGAAVARALRRSDQRRAGAGLRHRRQRAGSPPATTPT